MQGTADLTVYLAELTCGEEKRAERAVAALTGCGEPALQALRGLLASTDSENRWWAARALAEIADDRASALLIGALSDEDASVRQCAALALRRRPDPGAAPFLLTALSSRDHLLAHLAADALAAIGKPVVPDLLEVMEKGDQAVRLEAIRALAQIADPRSVPVLFAALDEDSALLEYWANEGLERMGVGMVFFKP